MSAGWVIGLAMVLNVVSVAAFVFAVRERRRIDDVRRTVRLPLTASRVDEATRRLRP